MPKRMLSIFILFAYSLVTFAAQPSGPMAIFKAEDEYDYIKENIKQAIGDRGMLVSGELHVSDMLNRTGKDLGFDRNVYVKAESIEFCSALISHKMTQIDATNLVICPFTIAVFIKTEEPNQVYVAFRRHALAGKADAVEAEIFTLLNDIVAEALE